MTRTSLASINRLIAIFWETHMSDFEAPVLGKGLSFAARNRRHCDVVLG